MVGRRASKWKRLSAPPWRRLLRNQAISAAENISKRVMLIGPSFSAIARASRRLEYKTQVFLNGTGDHLRTRLTHSIEVASISRTIARSLSLNEDLAETIALAHDLGHSPFGHSGEEMLAECMQEHGGFEHNRQSLRVVELLENAYPNFAGLNLTFEVREGLRKHQALYNPHTPEEEKYRCPSLEAQIANVADEITYYSHDLDDAVDFEILN